MRRQCLRGSLEQLVILDGSIDSVSIVRVFHPLKGTVPGTGCDSLSA